MGEKWNICRHKWIQMDIYIYIFFLLWRDSKNNFIIRFCISIYISIYNNTFSDNIY